MILLPPLSGITEYASTSSFCKILYHAPLIPFTSPLTGSLAVTRLIRLSKMCRSAGHPWVGQLGRQQGESRVHGIERTEGGSQDRVWLPKFTIIHRLTTIVGLQGFLQKRLHTLALKENGCSLWQRTKISDTNPCSWG